MTRGNEQNEQRQTDKRRERVRETERKIEKAQHSKKE